MAQKTSSTLIGIFVVGAVALSVAGVTYFGSGKAFAETVPFVLYFDGSLQGLDVGAPVLFRGVRVGSVARIVLRYYPAENRTEIPVFVELEPDRIEEIGGTAERGSVLPVLIQQGLRAQLVALSFLTGKLSIQLDFHPDKQARFVERDDSIREIPTIPSTLEQLTQTLQDLPVQELIHDLQSAVQGIDELIRSEDLKEAIRSLDTTIDDFGKLARDVNEDLEPLSERLNSTLDTARQTLQTADEKLTSLEGTLTETLQEFRSLAQNVNEQVDPTADSLKDTMAGLRGTLEDARAVLAAVRDGIGVDSPLYHRLVSVLNETGQLARSLRELADLLEQHPETIIQGKP